VLRQQELTSKSDVFSFGVCMWEILEKGKSNEMHFSFFPSFIALPSSPSPSPVPWIDKTNLEVSDLILKGHRLPKPENCPQQLYDIMLKCWRNDPDDRPSFHEVLTDLIAFSKTIQIENAAIIPIDQQQEEAE
jgi:serine/threonine protein kinase